MKGKRILTMGVAALMACAMLASCASGTAGNDKTSSVAEPEVTTGDDGREKINGVMYKEGLPIVDPGSYTFSIFLDDAQDDTDYVMFPILEEQTGVKVDLQIFPNEIAKEKLSLALGTGDYADSIGGWLVSETDVLKYGVSEGMYVPMEKYYADYCPKITEILELEGIREAMTTPDDHIYAIPYALEAPAVAYQPFVNTDWLKNVGMEMPKTTEEFRAVLKAFKEKDANGNGDAGDEVPFVMGSTNNQIGATAGWFGLSVDDEGFAMKDGKMVFGANTEEYKKGMKFLSELYAEGLMDNEMFTQDTAQWKAKGAKNLYGVSGMYASADIMPYDPGVVPTWEALPVLTSPECDKPVYFRNTYGTDILRSQVVVTDNAKNPEVIARWWDNFFQLENVLQSQHGPLDVTLFKTEDGSYKKNDVSKMSEADQKLYEWGNLFPQSLPKYVPSGFRTFEDPKPYDEKIPADKLYEPYLAEAYPKYWVDGEKATRLADLTTSIKDYVKQKRAEWISGQSDIDKDWDAYLKQLEKLNVQELLDIRLEAIG